MNKKDRIAIALSVGYFCLCIISFIILYGVLEMRLQVVKIPIMIFMSFLPIYWIYRFVIGDISFLPGFLKK